jgi:hypothetical protein
VASNMLVLCPNHHAVLDLHQPASIDWKGRQLECGEKTFRLKLLYAAHVKGHQRPQAFGQKRPSNRPTRQNGVGCLGLGCNGGPGKGIGHHLAPHLLIVQNHDFYPLSESMVWDVGDREGHFSHGLLDSPALRTQDN